MKVLDIYLDQKIIFDECKELEGQVDDLGAILSEMCREMDNAKYGTFIGTWYDDDAIESYGKNDRLYLQYLQKFFALRKDLDVTQLMLRDRQMRVHEISIVDWIGYLRDRDFSTLKDKEEIAFVCRFGNAPVQCWLSLLYHFPHVKKHLKYNHNRGKELIEMLESSEKFSSV